MKSYFLNLFDSQDQANQAVKQILYPENSAIPEYAYKMFVHSIMAQHIWFHRILKLPFDYDFQRLLNQEQVTELIYKNKTELHQILEEFDLEQSIEYKNVAGEIYNSKLKDILTHVSHHYSYHRGQIARTLREAGMEPPKTDLIIYNRST